MEKEVMALFSVVVVVAVLGMIFVEASVLDGGDITGQKSWRKKFKAAVRKVEKEVSKTAQRVEEEAERSAKKVEAEAKRFGESVEKEAGRFGNRAEAEWKRFDNRLTAELERSGDKVEVEFKRTNARIEAEINRIDDNLKKFGKEIEEKVKAELERLLKRVKNEVEAQRGVFKGLARGQVCDSYKSAQKSDAYNVNQLIYDTLMPPIKSAVRPPIQTIVNAAIPAVQSALAALNTIPVVGNAIYAVIAPTALAYMQGPMADDLSENAAKKAIREALEECD